MLTLVCGIPASGKTTHCRGWHSLSFDRFLVDTYKIENIFEANDKFLEDEDDGYRRLARYIMDRHLLGAGTRFECMFVMRWMRGKLIENLLAEGFKDDISCTYLLCDLETAMRRNETRVPQVPEEIILKAHALQEFPTESEGFDSVRFLVTGGK